LVLDLENFRTIPQINEEKAIHVLIAISGDWFWELLESLVESGYEATENI